MVIGKRQGMLMRSSMVNRRPSVYRRIALVKSTALTKMDVHSDQDLVTVGQSGPVEFRQGGPTQRRLFARAQFKMAAFAAPAFS